VNEIGRGGGGVNSGWAQAHIQRLGRDPGRTHHHVYMMYMMYWLMKGPGVGGQSVGVSSSQTLYCNTARGLSAQVSWGGMRGAWTE
jgi:hypothetical protein